MQVISKRKGEQSQIHAKVKLKQNQENCEYIDTGFEICFKRLLQISITVRLVSVFFVQTYFVPDEYWQSLEIAHLKVFGYGFETWEWIEGIRGYAYPMVFVALYKLLWILRLDYTVLLINGPRILQACLSAFADVSVFIFSKRLFGRTVGLYSYILHLSSWFIFYTGSRTLTNTTEMALVLIALGSYDWRIFFASTDSKQESSPLLGLISCGLSCIVRTSAVITWLPILLFELYYGAIKKRSLCFTKYLIIIATGLFSTSTLLDSMFYGKFIIVHWRFVQFNVLQNMSGFYGTHPWHWYITQGLPAVLFTQLPLLLLEISTWKDKSKSKISMLLVISIQLISLRYLFTIFIPLLLYDFVTLPNVNCHYWWRVSNNAIFFEMWHYYYFQTILECSKNESLKTLDCFCIVEKEAGWLQEWSVVSLFNYWFIVTY